MIYAYARDDTHKNPNFFSDLRSAARNASASVCFEKHKGTEAAKCPPTSAAPTTSSPLITRASVSSPHARDPKKIKITPN